MSSSASSSKTVNSTTVTTSGFNIPFVVGNDDDNDDDDEDKKTTSNLVVKKIDPEFILMEGFEKKFVAEGANFTMRGHGISAHSSLFEIDDLGIAFDGGIASRAPITHIFVTHGHTDHLYMLPVTLANLSAMKIRPTIFVPRGIKQLLIDLLVAKHRLSRGNANEPYDYQLVCSIVEVGDGDYFDIVVRGGQKMVVKIFATEHKVPSVGIYNF